MEKTTWKPSSESKEPDSANLWITLITKQLGESVRKTTPIYDIFDRHDTLMARAFKGLTPSRLKRVARGVALAFGIALCSASPAGQATTMQQKTPFAYSSSMIGETQTECLFRIAIKESNIRYNAINRSSGAYGAWQFLSKSVRGKTPHEQVLLAIDYANYRYGSPCKAWAFWQRNYWW